MINLLPPDVKESIVYARRNSQLRRWIVGSLAGLVGVVLVILGGQVVIRLSISDYESIVANGKEQLKQQDQQQTLKQVSSIHDNFKLVVDVLSREILFSKLLPRVGQVMPEGTVLEGLSLNTENEQTAVELTASAKDMTSGSQIHINLMDPRNNLFKKADLENINCPADQPRPTEYPCSVTIRALPATESEFLLMNSRGESK